MNKNIKLSIFFLLSLIAGVIACKKKDYAFGDLKTPSGLTVSAVVAGVNTANPNGDGSGNVTITASANNVITYKIDFGDGKTEVVPSGTVTHKYSSPGTSDYVITVNAVGTGGTTSVVTQKVTVFVNFVIPANIVQSLTNGTSRIWVTANDVPGHVGVGPVTSFSPDYYAATPNQRAACLYDDEITFTKVDDSHITMTVNNKGQTFIIAAATAFYSQSGGDNCYNLTTGGTQMLSFMDATSASTSANSTRIQFHVPGNGVVNFATGANDYEILSISDTEMHLRNIGADGLAWYQILKPKP